MADLVGFLQARINEDEEAAQAAGVAAHGVWYFSEPHGESVCSEGGAYVACGPWEGAIDPGQARHIARHDPARVLREVEAKRRILSDHRAPAAMPWIADYDPGRHCVGCGFVQDVPEHPRTPDVTACPVLRALALPYSDHPDYRQGWKLWSAYRNRAEA